MQTVTVGNFKASFSQILDQIRGGESITIAYGRRKQAVAVMVPYQQYMQAKRKLGMLQAYGSVEIGKEFKMTDQDLIGKNN